jgi:hypothetical protein
MHLQEHFQEPYIERALTAYVTARPSWNINAKIDLYRRADIAFDLDQPEDVSRAAFQSIYDELRSHWQVFRNANVYWDANTLFDVLTVRCHATSRAGGLTLAHLEDAQHGHLLLANLDALRNLKRNQTYPHMAASKFLHFFNPSLFPIYDTDAVWNRVCNGVFKADYRDFCDHHGFYPNETGARFNLAYTLWAAELIARADPGTMATFAFWAAEQAGSSPETESILGDLRQYYAVAFEFIAVGATYS